MSATDFTITGSGWIAAAVATGLLVAHLLWAGITFGNVRTRLQLLEEEVRHLRSIIEGQAGLGEKP